MKTDPIRKAAERVLIDRIGIEPSPEQLDRTEAIIREELADVVGALERASQILSYCGCSGDPDDLCTCCVVEAALAQLQGGTDD